MRRTLLIFGILPFIHLQHTFWLKVKYMLCIVFISKDPSTRRDTKDPSTRLVVTLRNNSSSKQILDVYNLSKLSQIKKDHISWFKWLVYWLTHECGGYWGEEELLAADWNPGLWILHFPYQPLHLQQKHRQDMAFATLAQILSKLMSEIYCSYDNNDNLLN